MILKDLVDFTKVFHPPFNGHNMYVFLRPDVKIHFKRPANQVANSTMGTPMGTHIGYAHGEYQWTMDIPMGIPMGWAARLHHRIEVNHAGGFK